MRLKAIHTIILGLLTFLQSIAQFDIDLGGDTIFCKGMYKYEPDTSYLGSNLQITNGTAPYTFSWQCDYNAGSALIHASDFLNDTTIPNPYFIDYPIGEEGVKFYLTVKDGLDNIAIDSILARFSSFSYLLSEQKEWIDKGDSVRLQGTIGGGVEPLNYYWSPGHSLNDSTISNPWAKPDTTTQYAVYAIDSIGCISDTVLCCLVNVNPVSIKSLHEDDDYFDVFYNDKQECLIIANNRNALKNAFIHVYNVKGMLLNKQKLNNGQIIEINDLRKRKTLIIKITQNGQIVYSKKIIIN